MIHPAAEVVHSTFEGWTEVGEGSRIVNSAFEAYAYCDRFADIANTTVGRFANIAAMTRIGPTDHPFAHAAQHHFVYRSSRYWDDAGDDAAFFAARAARRTTLGPDCWIGHGAIVVDEGWRSGSLSAEIAARIQEHAFFELDAPVLRVCSEEVPIPYPRHLEEAAVPQVDSIVAAARRIVGGGR